MQAREEWAINPKGQVMLSLGSTLACDPLDAHLTAMGRLILRMENGSQESFQPNRKVSLAIRRQDSILVSEPGPDGNPKGRWIPTKAMKRGFGMSPR